MTFEHQQALVDPILRPRAEGWSALAAAAGKALKARAHQLYRVWQAARAQRELRALSDRMLKDIGISRDEIDSLFR